jgi:hypothetical protein
LRLFAYPRNDRHPTKVLSTVQDSIQLAKLVLTRLNAS